MILTCNPGTPKLAKKSLYRQTLVSLARWRVITRCFLAMLAIDYSVGFNCLAPFIFRDGRNSADFVCLTRQIT
jgi:hypothetical protein